MRLGIQLFGTGAEWKRDPEAYYRQLKAFGYTGIEPCVLFGGEPDTRYAGVWSQDTFRAERRRLDAHQLEIPSIHAFVVGEEMPVRDIVGLIAESGVKRLVLKSPHPITRAACEKLAEQGARLADALRGVGAEVLIHNESHDIRTQLDGVTALEWELDRSHGGMFWQIDLGWALAGGEDVAALLQRNEARIHSLHYKDFIVAADGTFVETPIGEGDLDVAACVRFGLAHDLWQIVDSEITIADKMAQVALDAKRLLALGKA